MIHSQKPNAGLFRRFHIRRLSILSSLATVNSQKIEAKNYDLAIQHLLDLRDVAARRAAEDDFATRLAAFRESNGRRPSLLDRLKRAGL